MLNNSDNSLLKGFNNVYKCVISAEVIPRNANMAVSIRSRNLVSVVNILCDCECIRQRGEERTIYYDVGRAFSTLHLFIEGCHAR